MDIRFRAKWNRATRCPTDNVVGPAATIIRFNNLKYMAFFRIGSFDTNRCTNKPRAEVWATFQASVDRSFSRADAS